MLVLSRYTGESIIIDNKIRLTVMSFRGHGGRIKVRLGFEAEDDVKIHREEVQRVIDRQNGTPPTAWENKGSAGESAC